MKKIVALTAALLIALLCTLTACAEFYPMTAIVIEIDEKYDVVTVVNAAGVYWMFEGVEDWTVGDLVALMMDDNGTTKIFDDMIVKAYYGGRGTEEMMLDWMDN